MRNLLALGLGTCFLSACTTADKPINPGSKLEPESQVVRTTVQKGVSVTFDPSMGSAGAAYGNCLAAREGKLAKTETPLVPIGGDCSPYRQRAWSETYDALLKSGRPASDAQKQAEQNLATLEKFIVN